MSLLVTYTLDRENRIATIGGDWNVFAMENDASNLLAPNVIGRRINEFIIDDPTRMFINSVIDCSRVLGKTLTRLYRCDSPECRRFMEMTLEPQPHGEVTLRHKLLRVEPIAPPMTFIPAPLNSSKEVVTRCSMCNRLWIQDNWMEAVDAVNFGLLQRGVACRVVYGVCQTCSRPNSML